MRLGLRKWRSYDTRMDSHAFPIHQALAARYGDAEVRWLAHSSEFDVALQVPLGEIALKFGPRPSGTRCPEAWLVLPKVGAWAVLARVGDLGPNPSAPAALGFQFLILTTADYAATGADAFRLVQNASACWERRGTLPQLTGQPASRLRTIEEVTGALQREDGPLLLGATQALLDGSCIALQRDQPANDLFPALWMLLPYRNRVQFSVATFVFSNDLGLTILATPPQARIDYDYRYLSAAQAEYYPEGRYELNLQCAVESGDEPAMQRLFLRRTRADTLRMALWLLAGMLSATLVLALIKIIRP